MEYEIEIYKLKNGIEDLCIIFDEKYALLSTFLSSDVVPLEDWVKKSFDKVISGESEYEEFNGNVCCVEIRKDKTSVFDNLAEDAMGNWCEINTMELRGIIEEWTNSRKLYKAGLFDETKM